ncbi:MAG: aminodeoxychorismate/anthranilate synthase component II [Thermodesulfobacteriota bacterium]
MILLIDNYDSFTYNIAQALGLLGCEVQVRRADDPALRRLAENPPAAVVISPGPGRPEAAGLSNLVIERLAGRTPLLGVCLGHQCLAQVFGAKVERARRPVHGKTSEVFHDGRTLFQGLRNPLSAARYHSLIVPEESVAPPLEVSAYTLDGEVMGLRCPDLMIEGVQFHPESVATPQGPLIFKNFVTHYLNRRKAA